jgi:hypothetical protein
MQFKYIFKYLETTFYNKIMNKFFLMLIKLFDRESQYIFMPHL